MPQAISEHASENQPKQKRGRPPRFDAAWMDWLKGYFPETRTRRGRMNEAYGIRALRVLKHGRAFRWLCSTEEAISRGDGKLRFSILAELGRVDEEKTLRLFAREICKRKPRAKVAVALIRRWRTGKDGPGSAISLTDALIRCVNDYLATHPATTWQMVRAALTNTLDAVEEPAD